jgi:hypothetical protein
MYRRAGERSGRQVVVPVMPAAAVLVGASAAVVASAVAVPTPIRAQLRVEFHLHQFARVDKQTHDDSPLNATPDLPLLAAVTDEFNPCIDACAGVLDIRYLG